MARLYKRNGAYYGDYIDHLGIRVRRRLSPDRRAAQAMLQDAITKADRTKAGIIDHCAEHAARPLSEHLDTFRNHLKARDVSARQVDLVTSRCRRIAEVCRFVFIGDLSPSRVQGFLAELREEGLSAQTSNHYLRAIKQFSRWLIMDQRAATDVLAHLSGQNVKLDRRHDRRDLSDAELARLLIATHKGPQRGKLTGVDRAMLYRVAVFTGLRASELASLTPESFDLASDPPTVIVLAGYSKRRRQDTLPLHPSLVTPLGPWLAGRPPKSLLWPGNWARFKYAGQMLKADLKVAGIPYVDGAGRFGDFHSLRHTFITRLVRANVPPKIAQTLARHGDINLTMSRYCHLGVHDVTGALASVPGLSASAIEDANPTAKWHPNGTEPSTILRNPMPHRAIRAI